MAQRHVEVTTRSWGSRILGSFQGMIIGIVLLLLAFVLLWNNEGRTDLSRIADDSIPVPAGAVNAANDGSLVAVTGSMDAVAPLGDSSYLQPGPYLRVERAVEMYAWVERTESETETNLGGSETTTTEYSYEQSWTSRPANSSQFQIPEGHENPPLSVEEATFTAPAASIGAFTVEPPRIGVPRSEALSLSEDDLRQGVRGRVEGNYLLLGRGSLQNPRIGDVRISYRVVPAGQLVTAFGKQHGQTLVPYTRGDATLYTVYPGDRESALRGMHSSFKAAGWAFRVLGFLLMWGALSMILGPISTFLDVLPILGRLSRTMLGAVAFGIALLLSVITIVIAIIAHNILYLLLLLSLIVSGVWLLGRRRRPAPAPAT